MKYLKIFTSLILVLSINFANAESKKLCIYGEEGNIEKALTFEVNNLKYNPILRNLAESKISYLNPKPNSEHIIIFIEGTLVSVFNLTNGKYDYIKTDNSILLSYNCELENYEEVNSLINFFNDKSKEDYDSFLANVLAIFPNADVEQTTFLYELGINNIEELVLYLSNTKNDNKIDNSENICDKTETANCNDLCPNDPEKLKPGKCGCGVPEHDYDKDGAPNCNDECPNDKYKILKGKCGCNIPDTDSDSDGTPDCQDVCPNDPNKIRAGECGCGNKESDNCGTTDETLAKLNKELMFIPNVEAKSRFNTNRQKEKWVYSFTNRDWYLLEPKGNATALVKTVSFRRGEEIALIPNKYYEDLEKFYFAGYGEKETRESIIAKYNICNQRNNPNRKNFSSQAGLFVINQVYLRAKNLTDFRGTPQSIVRDRKDPNMRFYLFDGFNISDRTSKMSIKKSFPLGFREDLMGEDLDVTTLPKCET